MTNAGSSYKFTKDNIFDNWDLNPLAMQVGGGADGVRDSLAQSRDSFLQPLMGQYRQQATANGGKAAEDDASLFNDEGFRGFVQSGSIGAQNAPGYNWAQAPTSYKSSIISQFQVPNHAAMQKGTEGLVQGILDNPHTMTDQGVAQMKERQKELAAQLQGDQLGQAQASAAHRGFGSVPQGTTSAINDQFNQNLLSSYRDTDLQKLSQDRADEANAVALGQGYMQGDLGNAINAYQAQLSGQQAQNAANLGWANFGEGQRQFDAGQNFNWSNLANSNQLAMLRLLLGL